MWKVYILVCGPGLVICSRLDVQFPPKGERRRLDEVTLRLEAGHRARGSAGKGIATVGPDEQAPTCHIRLGLLLRRVPCTGWAKKHGQKSFKTVQRRGGGNAADQFEGFFFVFCQPIVGELKSGS